MRLRRVDCSAPGIRRVRRGRGFRYLDEDGDRVEHAETLERIRRWSSRRPGRTCGSARTPRAHPGDGMDAPGRKQYLYHEAWRDRRDREKFDEHAGVRRPRCPRLRERVERDLRRRGLAASACWLRVRLLDLGFFRVGSERYAEENETFGLATLRKRARPVSGRGCFDYPAKSGKRRVQAVGDRAMLRRSSPASAAAAAARSCSPTATGGRWRRRPLRRRQRPTSRSHRRATSPPRTSAPGTRPCSPR